MINNILELSALVLAVITGLSDHLWLSIGSCLIGMVICIVDIGKHDGWIR